MIPVIRRSSGTSTISSISSFVFRYSGYFTFVLVALYFSVRSPAFLTLKNVLNILLQSSALGIIACGMTAVIIGGGNHVIRGGIDLSLGNNLALNAAITAALISHGYSLWAAAGAALLSSVVVGVINAFAIVKLKFIPLLGTLSVMYILQGVQLLITNNKVISISEPTLNLIANGAFLHIPVPVWIFLIVGAMAYVLFNHTVFGNWVYAVGGNPEAARAAGVHVNLTLALTYIIASITAFIASLIIVARLSGTVTGIGDIMLLDILLAGLMSAVFSKLSVPNMTGAVLSALFVGMLSNGFTLINVPTYWVFAIKGALILVAVAITTTQQRRVKPHV
ncbi:MULTISPECIES: ABC transporter permease [Paenibacillus]|uniref:ABC transporter permease n=1 Tax=Paenibacillus TaxID=44249 RepID=UPI0006D02E36|nr:MULTISPECIES: ABC transporter permease [Paenibacillus]GCL74280.1 ABC transporter permease [Paenibacillus naphthalenovorans]